MRQALTEEELTRYSRQIMLKEIGEEGQKKLTASRVLVVGAGGLGSPVLYYLTAAGVGRIGIVDGDRVALSNLQRQIIHFTPDLGRKKSESAREKLTALNPQAVIETYDMWITDECSAELVAEYDLVVIAVDNFATRQILNKACYTHGKPLIEGAVGDFSGHVTTFLPPSGPCFWCLFPHGDHAEKKDPSTGPSAKPGDDIDSPSEAVSLLGKPGVVTGTDSIPPFGVIGALPGVIGSLQAGEAIKVLLGIGRPLLGKLLTVDLLNSEFKTLRYTRAQNCTICH